MISLWIPGVIDGKHGLTRNLLGLLLGELSAPRHALTIGSTLAAIVVFQVAGSLDGLGTPLVPTLRTNLFGQFAVHEERIAIIAPGTSQIHLIHIAGCGDATVVEDIAIGHILRRRCCRDVGIGLAEDVAVLKPCCGGTEDEVGGSLDIAMVEEKPRLGVTCIDGVLMSQEATVDKRQLVSFGMQGYGLSQSGRIILDGDILQGNLATLDF